MKAFFDLPFVQVALPIIIAFVWATITQHKRFDDLRAHFDACFAGVEKRLDKIDFQVEQIDFRLSKVEERTSLIQRDQLNTK